MSDYVVYLLCMLFSAILCFTIRYIVSIRLYCICYILLYNLYYITDLVARVIICAIRAIPHNSRCFCPGDSGAPSCSRPLVVGSPAADSVAHQ